MRDRYGCGAVCTSSEINTDNNPQAQAEGSSQSYLNKAVFEMFSSCTECYLSFKGVFVMMQFFNLPAGTRNRLNCSTLLSSIYKM